MITFNEWQKLIEGNEHTYDSDDFLYYSGQISKPSNKPAKFAMVPWSILCKYAISTEFKI